MQPIAQVKLHQPGGPTRGDCYAACIASILEIPLWMVPPFGDMNGAWRERTDEWLARFFNLEMVDLPGHEITELPEFYIASGLSPRGVKHSVIYSDGAMVHDPHPSGAGIVSVEWTWHMEPAS